MDADEYQKMATRTLIDGPLPGRRLTDTEHMIVWNAIGLAGEAGEVSELVKHGIFHGHGLDVARIEKELGDVLWYVAALCTKTGLTLGGIMEKNVAKLRARYPKGYTEAHSKARLDGEPEDPATTATKEEPDGNE